MASDAGGGDSAPVFINDIHYDNSGTDTGEAIEIAGPSSTDLTDWQIFLYNGVNGEVYDTRNLSGTIADAGDGYGFVTPAYATNGGPDGIALVLVGSGIKQRSGRRRL